MSLGGRKTELDWVRSLLSGGSSSNGIIVGSPGMGKSAIVEEALETLEASASPYRRRILRLQGSPVLATISFGALAPLLGTMSGLLDESTVLHELMRSLQLGADEAENELPPMLVVDDAQFMDPASAFVLSQLVQARTIGILLLSTDISGVEGALDAICDGAQLDTLVLGGLGHDAVRDQCSQMLGGRICSSAVMIIAAVTNGNPLLIASYIKSARSQATIVQRSDIWFLTRTYPEPDPALREVVRELQQRMPEPLQRSMEFLALAGHQSRDVLNRLTGVEPSALGYFGIIGSLDEQMVHIASPLYADVLRSLVPPGRSENLHQQWQEDGGTSSGEQTFRQILWAIECGEVPGRDALLQAARKANNAKDHESAWKLLQCVSQEVRDLDDTLEEAQALLGMGRPRTAYAILESSLGQLHDLEDLPRLMSLCIVAAWQAGEPVNDLNRLRELWQAKYKALGSAMDGDQGASGGSLENNIGLEILALWIRTADPQAHQLAIKRATRMGPMLGTSCETKLAINMIQSRILAEHGALDQAASLLIDVLAILESHPDSFKRERLEAVVALAFVHACAGTYSLAMKTIEDEILGNPEEILWKHGSLQLVRALISAFEGRMELASDLLAEAVEELQFHDPVGLGSLALGLQAFADSELGNMDGENNRRKLDEFTSEFDEVPANESSGMALMAHALLSTLEDRTAAQQLPLLAGKARTWGNRVVEREIRYLDWRRIITSGQDAALASDKLIEAARVVDGSRSIALSRLVGAHLDGGGTELEAAATELYSSGEVGLGIEALAHAVLRHAETGDERNRGVAVRRLNTWIHDMGECRRGVLAKALSVRELTFREQEIVDLAISGKSNREIARELTVSQRTVEGHLYRIFTKLGITERSQLADRD